ncbi:TM2 domain-containing protein [Lacinutrix algicola]|uniref:TM2 domain-containing protein n=1 Tax=Lacinutrix algicola TaxID=342954 RepID=UPI0006E13ED2|nr:TM2 domain-containing protein [Lacinutrix algicola]
MSDEKNLKDGLDDMLGDAKEGAKKAADKASELAGEAKESMDELADDAKDAAKEFSDSAKEAFNSASGDNKKILAGVLAILFGWLGVHKFILGYQKEGIIMAAVGILGWFLCGIPTTIVAIVALIEGIMYLTKSDEEFYNTYQVGRKPWF